MKPNPAPWAGESASGLDLLLGPSLLAGVYGLLLGAVFASFYAVVQERIPRGEGLGGRSHCFCGRRLTIRENIPVIGWILARGRARCCNQPIPRSYLIGESVGSLVIGAVALFAGLLSSLGVIALWGAVTFVVANRRRSGSVR